MPMIIPAGFGLVSVGTVTTDDPEPMFWTYGVNLASYGNEADYPDEAHAEWNGTISTVTSTVVELVTITLKVGPNATGPTYESTLTNVAGDEGGGLPPPNTAVLVQKQSALGGRRNRGRFYLPGVPVNTHINSGGVFIDGFQSTIQAAVDDYFVGTGANLASGPAPWVILHDNADAPTAITGLEVQTRLATQRRRLRP